MTAVLFDLDGTLIDSLPNVTDAANAVLRSYGLPDLTRGVVAGFIGLGEQVFVDRLIAATLLEPGVRPEILARFIEAYKVVAEETRCFPDVVEVLSRMKARGVPLGVVTNKPRAPLIPTLEAAGLSEMFGSVVAGDDMAVRKPDPAPLLRAMRELGEERCIYIGDSPIDGETATRAEVPFGLFTEGIRTVAVDDIPHDFAFERFSDLPGLLEAQGFL